MMFPDFSFEIHRRQNTFTDIRKCMREKGLRYSMRYLSKLRVQRNGTVKFYGTPREVCDRLEAIP